MDWKVGDWCIFDLSIGQIKRLDEYQEFSDGSFCTSGRLKDRFRPLTLRNKRIIEWFDFYYRELDKIDGSAGFNYPDIARYFQQLALYTIDANEFDAKAYYEWAQDFIKEAKEYKNPIQGVRLFRPKALHG